MFVRVASIKWNLDSCGLILIYLHKIISSDYALKNNLLISFYYFFSSFTKSFLWHCWIYFREMLWVVENWFSFFVAFVGKFVWSGFLGKSWHKFCTLPLNFWFEFLFSFVFFRVYTKIWKSQRLKFKNYQKFLVWLSLVLDFQKN